MGKDFDRKELGEGHVDDTFHELNDKMKHSFFIHDHFEVCTTEKSRRS